MSEARDVVNVVLVFPIIALWCITTNLIVAVVILKRDQKMNLTKDEISSWCESLEGFKPEYSAVKATSVIQFFRLKGRTTSMIMSNLEFIPDLHYTIYDPNVQRYYLREYRGYDIDTLYLYKPTLTFSGEDESVSNLRRYVQDGNLYLLFTPEQVKDTTAMLERIYKSHFTKPGKLDYRIFIELLKLSIDLEDYRDYGRELIGYLTMVNKYETSIRQLWEKAYIKNQQSIKN